MGNLMNFQFFQNPYFIFGLLIRLSLVYISTPTLIENLYLPFLETSINNISINPWNNWLKSDEVASLINDYRVKGQQVFYTQ